MAPAKDISIVTFDNIRYYKLKLKDFIRKKKDERDRKKE